MKSIKPVLLVSLTLLMSGALACKKVTVGKYRGGGAADAQAPASGDVAGEEALALLDESTAAADEQLAAEDEVGGEATEEPEVEGEQGLKERFNMVKWIKTRPNMKSIYEYIDEGHTMFFMGDKGKFRIETNGTFGVSPDFESGEEERKLGGKFWLKAYALGQHLKPKDDEVGLFLDIGTDAVLDKLNIEMWFRIVGDDIASRSVMAGFDQAVTREKTLGASVIPGVSGEIGMGGEMGLRTEFGIRRDNVLNLIYTPRASMNAHAAFALGAKGIATTGIKGTLRIADLKLKGSGNLGFHMPTKLLYFDFGLDPGELKLLEGRIYYVIAEVLGKELGTIDIWKPNPVATVKTPGYSSAFIKFLEEPKDCRGAVASAGNMLAGSIKKLEAYEEQAPEEDKAMTKHSIARAGMVYRQVQEYCKG